ncbi:helix-turn-helix transcriptional regulator [Arsenophonus nasoniae]|uniref:Helix-turn-helix transcriptional regulator n=1 Tax=Arsenophonus nasoniae TaxID=638 RepID=A0AA95K651_9GAMM|nr:helix-turn-helix transcriptional regulator [Arsenophonus nasoniae]WGL93948.1 helix-turn-helix transcriptional regulator [Arsenophonus nasoniae]
MFTAKEWQILFFTMQRLSSKEIARRLDISRLTVETHLKTIYGKTKLHSAFQLRVFSKSKGFDRYIPSEFINKGRGFLEMGGIA